MAWIESHQELARHPKTKKLARKLKVTVPAAIGHLHLLWWWALDFAPDGNLSKYEVEDIAEAAMSEIDAEDFIHALKEAGWIDQEGTSSDIRLHDWYDYAGRLLEKREVDKERKRKARGSASPVRRTSDGQAEDGERTVPNRTVPDRTVPEDKPSDDDNSAKGTGDEWMSPEEWLQVQEDLDKAPVEDLSPVPNSVAAAQEPTLDETYLQVFGKTILPPMIQSFIADLLTDKGMAVDRVKELLLEAGASANSGNVNLKLLEPIAKRWLAEGINTRAEAKRNGTQRSKGSQRTGSSSRNQRGKPQISVVQPKPAKKLTREEYREMRDMAHQLDKRPLLTEEEFEREWQRKQSEQQAG
ncbi:DnaD domain protein [Paenibacillus sp. KR2-11]|uniref:DnaD domain protein n=1 Tax=Paenibacillus sp. KR2-11 TaxID=3385500 RepID=UPI0038FCE3E7